MNTVKTNIRNFKSRAKTNAYMNRFTATAKRLGMIPHYDISINGRTIVITLTARPLDVTPCANAMRPLCKDKNDLINTVHACTYNKVFNIPITLNNTINHAKKHAYLSYRKVKVAPQLIATPFSRLIISHLV